MELKPGYKQTEVGVIPQDWRIQSLIDCCDYADYRGKTPAKTASGTFLVTARNVREGSIDYDVSQEYVASGEYEVIMRRGKPQLGDVLITTEAPMGNVAQVDREDVALAQRIIKYRPKNSSLSSNYLKYYLLSDRFQAILDERASGSTAKGIKGSVLHQLPVVIPPLGDQQAIATALSDVDALITALDRLIAKKRDIKQAAMQELLTGKRRLPGFSEEWGLRLLPEVCWFQEGPGVRNTQFTHSGVKLLNGTNIFRGEVNLENTDRFISEKEAFGPYAHFLVDAGDIIIASSGITIDKLHEKVAFVRESHLPLCMNTSTIRFKAFPEHLLTIYLYYLLMSDSFKKQVGLQATGSAQLNFGPFHVSKVVFVLPDLNEQHAIAEILSDMDAEIAALEQKRDKTRLLKQGMMQELLTGKTRLL